MDELDHKILDLLRKNARMSFSEIGNAVGISRVSVKKRMTAMENAGIIRGYHAVTDEEHRSVNPSTMESHVNYLFNHTKGIRKIGWHILMSDLRAGKESVDGTEKENSRGF